MKIIQNIKENIPDILAALAAAILFTGLNGWAQRLANSEVGFMWLANITDLLSNVTNFALATVVAWVSLSVVWREQNAFMVSEEYDDGYAALSPRDKFLVLVFSISVLILGACLIFQ